MLESIA